MDKPTQKRRDKLKANRHAFVFLFCILLAMFIWFINALSKTYTSVFKQQVIYKALPVSTSSAQLPPQLVVEVTGRGFDLMQYSFSKQSHEIIIDLKKLPATVFAGNQSAISTMPSSSA